MLRLTGLGHADAVGNKRERTQLDDALATSQGYPGCFDKRCCTVCHRSQCFETSHLTIRQCSFQSVVCIRFRGNLFGTRAKSHTAVTASAIVGSETGLKYIWKDTPSACLFWNHTPLIALVIAGFPNICLRATWSCANDGESSV